MKKWTTTRTLCIDPSIKACGWGVFSEAYHKASPYDPLEIKYVDSGVLNLSKDRDDEDPLEWVKRCDTVCLFFEDMHGAYGGFDRVLIEMPHAYSGGKGDVANNSGAVMKLAFLVASLRAHLRGGMSGDGIGDIRLIPVRRWKGTVPKHVTQQRVRRYWGLDKSDHNEMDALGIADWFFRKHLKYGDRIVKHG